MKKINFQESAEFIKSKHNQKIDFGIILGSGLGDLTKKIVEPTIIPYSEIPNLPSTSVIGHEGALYIGKIGEKTVAAFSGRFHLYEGHSTDLVTAPIKILHYLGCKNLIVSNAAGGINKSFAPGDLVIINDHLNLTGTNPLLGPNDDSLGTRFPDMSETYSRSFKSKLLEIARDNQISLKEGIYAGVLGPSYETPAEIRMLSTLGGDMVGMSTVTEVISAAHLGMNICGVSCITNYAAGISDEKLMHEDIKDQANKSMASFCSIIEELIKKTPLE